jgi:hypothetical protein
MYERGNKENKLFLVVGKGILQILCDFVEFYLGFAHNSGRTLVLAKYGYPK